MYGDIYLSCISLSNYLTAGISIFGIGLESYMGNCAAAIYICIAFYGTSKMLIYLFLSVYNLPAL